AIEVRRAYVDFKWPDTKVGIRAGYMGLSLPAAIGGGSMILDEEVSALTVTSPITDNVSVLAGYARALSGTATHRANHDAYDLGVLALPLDFDGIKLTPFLMYGFAEYDAIAESGVPAWEQGLLTLNGTNAASSKKTWWAGLAFEMTMFDPFVVKADLNYGSVDGNGDADDRSGWLFDASLAYTGWDFMTPELFFAYTSGEDGNSTHGDGDSERMPVLRVSNWHVGSFWFGNPSYSYDLRGSTNRYEMLGFWTVGLTLKDISFLEKLSHEFTLLYAQGTNDKDCATARANGIDNSYGIVYGRTLTEKDSIVEVDLNTKYKIYEELSALFDIGYVNADYDTNYWGNDYNGGDMWKVALSVDYTF
ncbi:MAG: outer membrane homotrimeric porin, partial [Desulfovibrionaceae bacterium]|nr:outer membrane homotrimeric porin [Desulfovibrionaceae bacterium]